MFGGQMDMFDNGTLPQDQSIFLTTMFMVKFPDNQTLPKKNLEKRSHFYDFYNVL